MSDMPDRIYAIQHEGDEIYAGWAGDRQVLIAPAGLGLAALFFDAGGPLIETNQRQLADDFPAYYDKGYDRAFRQEIDRYARDIGLAPRTIHVRRFDAPEVGFRIEYPAWLAEARRDLELGQKSAAELELLALDVASWEAKGLFVLR